jgi:DNA-binding CsgD family transcriptional regulator
MIQQHQLSCLISTDLHIQRYRNGICLMETELNYPGSGISLSHLFDSPIVTYFMDTESRAVLVNTACSALNSASSAHDMINKNATHYYKSESALMHIVEDKAAIETKSLVAVGKSATRIDDSIIDVINFKLPWYQGKDIIGVLGLTLSVDNNNLHDLTQKITLLLGSGLFSPHQVSKISTLATSDRAKVYFTSREMDVLFHLLRGKTASEIGITLSISRRTVENNIARIKEKSHCKSKYDLITKFIHLVK